MKKIKSLIFATVGLVSAIGTASYGSSAFSITDNIGNFASIDINVVSTPSGTFTLNISILTTDSLAGAGYTLQTSLNGSGLFKITARDTSASPFTDLQTTNGTALTSANATLDPVNNNDLGGLHPELTGQPSGTVPLSVLTIAYGSGNSLPALPIGTYTFALTNLATTLSDLNEGDGLSSNSYTVNVIPEPASLALLGLGLGALGFRRRARR